MTNGFIYMYTMIHVCVSFYYSLCVHTLEREREREKHVYFHVHIYTSERFNSFFFRFLLFYSFFFLFFFYFFFTAFVSSYSSFASVSSCLCGSASANASPRRVLLDRKYVLPRLINRRPIINGIMLDARFI